MTSDYINDLIEATETCTQIFTDLLVKDSSSQTGETAKC
jgi:hypothetical protein